MNYLDLIKNKYNQMNYFEKLITAFVVSFAILFIFSIHCFVFTRKMFFLLFTFTLFISLTTVFISELISDKKDKRISNSKFKITFDVITIITVLNTLLQQLNFNVDFLLRMFESRMIDLSLLLNINKVNFLIDFVNTNLILLILIVMIYSLLVINKISQHENRIILIEKVRLIFNIFKQNLTLKNENYGFLYKPIP